MVYKYAQKSMGQQMTWLLMYGCSSKIFDRTDIMKESSVYVLDEILFARSSDEGTWGFDIDGRSSIRVDSQGCFHEDLIVRVTKQNPTFFG